MHMQHHKLSFCRIILLADSIAEIIVDDSVEVNAAMVDEFHEFLLSQLRAPFSLLVNKVNRYSYDFHAQMKLASIRQIEAIAVVAYSRVSAISAESMTNVPRETPVNMKVFPDRESALHWLIELQLAHVH
jgi:hypothetical protein